MTAGARDWRLAAPANRDGSVTALLTVATFRRRDGERSLSRCSWGRRGGTCVGGTARLQMCCCSFSVSRYGRRCVRFSARD